VLGAPRRAGRRNRHSSSGRRPGAGLATTPKPPRSRSSGSASRASTPPPRSASRSYEPGPCTWRAALSEFEQPGEPGMDPRPSLIRALQPSSRFARSPGSRSRRRSDRRRSATPSSLAPRPVRHLRTPRRRARCASPRPPQDPAQRNIESSRGCAQRVEFEWPCPGARRSSPSARGPCLTSYLMQGEPAAKRFIAPPFAPPVEYQRVQHPARRPQDAASPRSCGLRRSSGPSGAAARFRRGADCEE
jgi:hypothetical protein